MPTYPRDPELHKNHRARLRKKVSTGGFESLEDHELLELILFFSIPRVDTNETAHIAIKTFGSLTGVLSASPDELLGLPRIGPNSVVLLKTLQALCERYLHGYSVGGRLLTGTSDVVRLSREWYADRGNTNLLVITMDSLCRLQRTAALCVGGDVYERCVAVQREALPGAGVAVAVAYVGRDGFSSPTKEDRLFAKELAARLRRSEISLLEAVVFIGNEPIALSDYAL